MGYTIGYVPNLSYSIIKLQTDVLLYIHFFNLR